MKNSSILFITGIFILFLFPGLLYSQNYNDALRLSLIGLGSNARALGMGNAYTALSDDFSASSYNPAGLGLLRRMEIAGGINYLKFNNDATFYGNQTDYSNSSTKLNNISFAFPFPTIRGSMVFSIGYSKDRIYDDALSFDGFNNTNTSMIRDLSLYNDDVPYELYLSYPLYNSNDDYIKDTTVVFGNLNQSGTYISEGSLGKWSFSGAVEVAKNMFFGGTLNIITGEYKKTRDYYEDDVDDVYGRNVRTDPTNPNTTDFQFFHFNDILDWDISGWDAKLGFLYQPNNYLRFGGSIKFPTNFTIKEDYITGGSSEFASTGYTLNPPFQSNIEYEITSPFIFSGGAAVALYGAILSGDISYIDYSEMEFSGNDLSASQISNNNRDIKELFTGVLNLNVGAEYTIPNVGVRLRGGFILNPSPFDGDPSDFDKKYLTGGIGFLADETFAIDAAYAYGWWKDIGDNYSTDANGNFAPGVSRTFQDVNINNLILTFTYRF